MEIDENFSHGRAGGHNLDLQRRLLFLLLSILSLHRFEESENARDAPHRIPHIHILELLYILHRTLHLLRRILKHLRLRCIRLKHISVCNDPSRENPQLFPRNVHIEVGFGIERAVEELQRVRARDDSSCPGLHETEAEGVGEVAGEVAVYVEGALEVGEDGEAGRGAGTRDTKDGARSAERQDAVNDDRIRDETVDEDAFFPANFLRGNRERVDSVFDGGERRHCTVSPPQYLQNKKCYKSLERRQT